MDEGRQVVKAMAVIRRPVDGALLVCEYTGPDSAPFHRLIGGHVELMEKSADTIHREFAEELAQAVTDVQLLGVLENMFTWRGRDQHEIVFIYTARFEDPAAYRIAEQRVLDDDRGYTRVIWRAASVAIPPLYPDGVTQLAGHVPVSPGRVWVDDSVRTIVEVPSLTGSHVIPAGTEGVVLGTRPGGACLVDVVLQPQAGGQDGDFHQAWLRPGQYVLVDPRRPELPGAETGSGTGDPDAPSRPCVLTCPDSAGLLVPGARPAGITNRVGRRCPASCGWRLVSTPGCYTITTDR